MQYFPEVINLYFSTDIKK